MGKIIACLVVIFYAAGSGGEIYKWKDENGTTVYSQKPRENGSYEYLSSRRLDRLSTMGKPVDNGYEIKQEKRQVKKNVRIIRKRGQNCDRYEAQLERVSQQLRSPHYYKKRGPLRKKKRELESAIQKECW